MSWTDIAGLGGIGIIALLSLIQIAPIKINPWTAIGNILNADIREEIKASQAEMDMLSDRLDGISAEMAERAARDRRTRILRFGDELYTNQRHSKEHFEDILADITDYEAYCAEHADFLNGRTEITVRHIKSVYEKRLAERDFL